MPEWLALSRYLNSRPDDRGDWTGVMSSFWASLGDARRVTGRDFTSGEVRDRDVGGTWIGAVGYLAFLDQVGTAVRRARGAREYDTRGRRRNPIDLALRDFSPRVVSERDRQALYALRCALAHDYSLFNNPTEPRRSHLRFNFALSTDRVGDLIKHARRRWEGDFGRSGLATRTWVSLPLLGDLVEGCAAQVLELYDAGRLRTRLTPDELSARYTIAVS